MTRPRRHVIINSIDNRIFNNNNYLINFAYDETRHVTRLLEYTSLAPNKPLYCTTKQLYSIFEYNNKPLYCIYETTKQLYSIFEYNNKYYEVVDEAIFDKNSYLYHDWWIMASDIGCVYDNKTNSLKYIPISAYCKALQCHTLPYLKQNDLTCLSQIWVRNPNDKVSDCSMSFCTAENQVISSFDLGEKCFQSDISGNTRASRYLNLCFNIVPCVPSDSGHIEENDYGRFITAKYKRLPFKIECYVYAYLDKQDMANVCEDAEGWVDLSYYGCAVDQSRVYLKNGIGKITVYQLENNKEFSVGLTVHLKDAIRITFKEI